MGITNAPGVSFCWVGDEPIFLDLIADRYLALSPAAGRALRRLVEGHPAADEDAAHAAALVDRRLVLETPGDDAPLPCPGLPAATQTLLDTQDRARALHRWSAVADILTTRVRLRTVGLARTLRHVEGRKEELRPTTGDDLAAKLSAPFQNADGVLGSLDLCVPRSVAMALRAARLGYECDLVIGVKLRPFAAHCWVQRDHLLLNERIDVARQFTPILVI